jgi:hypothetical protein
MPSSTTYSALRPLLLVSLVCAMNEHAFAAADWDIAASVSPGIFYSDNVCLSNTDKKSTLDLDWAGIGLLTPTGSISSKGSRASFNLDGSVQFNTLTNGDLKSKNCRGGFNNDRDQFAPNIYATGSGILIKDFMTVSGSATANQNQVSPYLGGGTDTLNRNGNTNTYYLYSVSPVISHRIRDTAKYSVRYTYREVINSQDVVSDSTSNALAANLSNDTSSKLSWSLLGNYRKVEYSNSDYVNIFTGRLVQRQDTTLQSAGLQLGYQIDRRWQVNARTGWEWNDFQQYYKGNDTGGSVWDYGVRWTPSTLTSVSLGITSRFYGKAPRINISHRRKKSLFTASYNKSITFANDIRTQQDLLNPNYINYYALNSTSPILDERLTLGYSYTGRNTTIGLSGTQSQQTQADNGQESTFRGLALSVSPQLSSVYTLSGTVAWNDSETDTVFAPGARFFGPTSEYWTASVSLGRPINSRTTMSINYQYTDQTANDTFGGYQENRILATLNISLF